MFQVASHSPAAFHPHQYQPHSSSAPNMQLANSVRLPRTLDRPAFVEISPDAITAINPELRGVPAEYIRNNLRAQAAQMLAANSSLPSSHLPSSMPRASLGGSMTIPLRSAPVPTTSYPSHILALSSSKAQSDTVLLFPVHAIVLASHCSSLPRLPASTSQVSASAIALPVLPLKVPAPNTFAILHSFMYTHRLDSVLKALIPVPPTFATSSLNHQMIKATLGAGPNLHQLSVFMFQSAGGNLQTLTAYAGQVKDLWQNMVALGLFDPELWNALDLAWEVTLGALNLAQAASKK